jgi:hypothetical protein
VLIGQSIPVQSAQTQASPQPVSVPAAKKTSNIKEAAQLTNKERNPEAWLTGVADERGFGKEFRQIVEAARSVGLYARFQNNWWVVKFTLPNKGNFCLFELGRLFH